MVQRGSILLIDDEINIRESIKEALCDDYAIVAARSGEEAIEMIKRGSPNLVILDIKLPGIDGIDTLRLIKSIDVAVPVIMLSAVRTVSTVIKSYKMGAYDYFDKPFDLEKLKASVARAMQIDRNDTCYEEHELPLDIDSFIQSVIDDTVRDRANLEQALQLFRERYIELVTDKYMRNQILKH